MYSSMLHIRHEMLFAFCFPFWSIGGCFNFVLIIKHCQSKMPPTIPLKTDGAMTYAFVPDQDILYKNKKT